MVTAKLHILYYIGGYLIVSGSWKYLPLLFVMKILAPFQESHSQYFVDIDDNDTVKRSQRLVQTLTYKLTDIYIYCSEIEISKPFVTIFFHDGIPSFEILEGWSKGDPFKGTKGNWSTSVNQVGKEIKSLRNWVFVWLSTFTVPGKLKVVRIKIKYCWKDTRLCSGIQIVDLSPRNKEQLDAFKYQSGPRLVAGDCVGQTTGGVLFSNVTEETLNYQSWE